MNCGGVGKFPKGCVRTDDFRGVESKNKVLGLGRVSIGSGYQGVVIGSLQDCLQWNKFQNRRKKEGLKWRSRIFQFKSDLIVTHLKG